MVPEDHHHHHRRSEQNDEQRPRTVKDLADILSQKLTDNHYLFNKCRELSLHFYWVFTTCSLLAPPFEDGEQPKLPFDYLHQELSKEKAENYPVYAIELDRFVRLVHYADIHLTKDEIMDLAQGTESLRKSKDYGLYVLYDRLLVATREATL